MGLICGSGAVRWMYELRFGNVLWYLGELRREKEKRGLEANGNQEQWCMPAGRAKNKRDCVGLTIKIIEQCYCCFRYNADDGTMCNVVNDSVTEGESQHQVHNQNDFGYFDSGLIGLPRELERECDCSLGTTIVSYDERL